MNNEKGYILPFVLIICTFIFFLLSHQITMYMTDLRFYKERFQMNYLDTLMQKSMVEIDQRMELSNFTNTMLQYEEGRSVISFTDAASNQKKVAVSVHTDNKRKASVILYYDLGTGKLVKWMEVR